MVTPATPASSTSRAALELVSDHTDTAPADAPATDPAVAQPRRGDPEQRVVSRIAHAARHGVAGSRLSDAPGPWWARLDTGFARRHEPFHLRPRDRARVTATAASDKVLRTLASAAVGALAIPVGYRPRELKASLEDRAFYEQAAGTGDASRFFVVPPPGVRMRVKRVRTPGMVPDDGACFDLRFNSPYEPFNPRVRDRYLSNSANQTAHARYWRHDRPRAAMPDGTVERRPVLIAVHGFTAEQHWLNVGFQSLRRFYKRGVDVLHVTLPFHGPRQARTSPFSGHGFFAGGVSGINEAFGQAVHDIRVFMDWLGEAEGAERFGATGVSLGGYTTALLASVDRRFELAIPNVPVISLADLMLEWHPISYALRGLLKAVDRTVHDVRRALAVSCPLSYEPVVAHDGLMIVGGVGDRFAPPKQARLLWDHWNRPTLHWFPGSHLLHLDRGEVVREMERFMAGHRFLPSQGG